MALLALLCALFFFGYLAIRLHWQAVAFLALGAGYQVLSYLAPPPDLPAATPDTTSLILVTLSSVAGYVAWRLTREHLPDAPLSRGRIGVFLGLGANVVIAAFILWQTGAISFP